MRYSRTDCERVHCNLRDFFILYALALSNPNAQFSFEYHINVECTVDIPTLAPYSTTVVLSTPLQKLIVFCGAISSPMPLGSSSLKVQTPQTSGVTQQICSYLWRIVLLSYTFKQIFHPFGTSWLGPSFFGNKPFPARTSPLPGMAPTPVSNALRHHKYSCESEKYLQMARKRIQKEILDLGKENLGDMKLEPSESSIFEWMGSIPGPIGSVYEGGVFNVKITLPNDYP